MKLKRIMALVLCFAMVLSTMSFNVFAATNYLTAADVFPAADADGVITLVEDITLPEDTRFSEELKINLNGKTLILTTSVTFNGSATLYGGTINADGVSCPDGIIRADYHHDGEPAVTLTLEDVTINANEVEYGTGLFYVEDENDTLVLTDVQVVTSGADEDPGSGVFYSASSFSRAKVVLNEGTTVTSDYSKAIFFATDVELDGAEITCSNVSRPVFRQAAGTVKDSIITVNSIGDGQALVADEAGNNFGVVNFVNSTVIAPEGTPAVNFSNDGSAVKVDSTSSVGNNEGVLEEDTSAGETIAATVDGVAYPDLQSAIDDAYTYDSDVTVTLEADFTGDVTIKEKVGLYLTLDGNDKTFNGKITVNSLSDTNDNRRTTIKNVNFVSEEEVDFITSVETNHYPRIAVEGCSFTGNGKDEAVAIRTKSAYGLIIKDCAGAGLHSFLQNTSGVGISISGVKIIDSKGGLALGTAQNVSVSGCEIEADGYGIRLDAVLDTSAALENNKVNAYIPVVVRKATATDYNLSFTGDDNAYTASNTDGKWCVIGTDEYEEGKSLPVAPVAGVDVICEEALTDGLCGYTSLNGKAVVIPEGSVTLCYTGADRFWGEASANAEESFVILLFEGDKQIASASLNNIGGIINGNVYVTWNIPFAPNTDAYWNVEWAEGYPKYDMNPTAVRLFSDGVEVSENVVKYNAPDDLKKIVALAEDAEGNVKAYEKLEDAVASAAKVSMVRDTTLEEALALPANITFNGNGKNITGNLVASGDVTFVGHTKVTNFDAGYNKPVITVGEGACLEYTGTGRAVIGHGATFNIIGTIEDAKTAANARAIVEPSLIMQGASFTGAGVNFNVKNACISVPSSYCSSSKSASGTFNFDIENSIWESAGKLAFEAQSTAATVNFKLKDSVLNTGSHLVFAVNKGEIVIDNSIVNEGNFKQLENRSNMTIKNGSVVYASVATSSNANHPGTLTVDNATFISKGEFSGADLGQGTLVVKNGASFTADTISKVNYAVDKTSTFTVGTVKDSAVFEKITVVEVKTYEQLIAALAEDNAEVKMMNDITATATQNLGYGKAGIVVGKGDILDGNNYTLTINGANSTWDCAIAMTGGTVKNLTVAGAMRGIFMPGANDDVVIDSVVFDDVIYTFNSDAGSKDHTVTVKNTTLNGWTSFSDAHKAVVFDTCTFGEGNGYAYCRPWQASEFKNCAFPEGYEFDAIKVADNSLAFDNCTYNGSPLSEENGADMFYNGGIVVVNGESVKFADPEKVVAKIGGKSFESLNEAFAAAVSGATIDIVADVTISDTWDCRSNGAKFTVPVTINGNGHTLKLTGTVDDRNWNTVFRFEDNATVKNLTIDASEATSIQRGISAKYNITVEGCTLIGNGTSAKRAIIFGEGAGSAISNVTATVTDSAFKGWSYGVSDNQSGKDAKSVSITDSKFENSSVLISASETVTFTGNEMESGYVNISSYSVPNELSVIAKENILDTTETYAKDNTIKAKTIDAQDGFNTPVAIVNGKYYTDLQVAIDAANGSTITIVDDMTLVDTTYTIADGMTVTLDLNGKKITVTENKTNNYELFYNHGDLKVTGNGSVELTATVDRDWNAMSTIFHSRGGVLTIEDGTFTHNGGTDMAYVVDNSANWSPDTTTNIEGGSLSSTYIAIRNRMDKHTSNGGGSGISILNVSGGTIYGYKRGIWGQASSSPCKANITITGGTVTSVEQDAVVVATADGSEINTAISGGIFSSDVSAFLVDGVSISKNADGTYGVVAERKIEVSASTDKVVAGEEFTVTVKLTEGENIVNAAWTLGYETDKFELKGSEEQTGSIKEVLYKTHTNEGEKFAKGDALKTYTFVAKAVAQEVTGYFTLSDTTASTFAESRDNIYVAAVNNEKAPVTIIMKEYNVTAKLDETPIDMTAAAPKATVVFDGKAHTVIVGMDLENVDYEVTYTVNGEAVEKVELTGVGEYKVEYTIDAENGYADKTGVIEITITEPDFVVEATKWTNMGKKLVLVYTMQDNLYFTYNNNLMIDVTERGYKFENTTEYAHVFAFVTDDLIPDDAESYKANIKYLTDETGLVKLALKEPEILADINFSRTLNVQDISVEYGIVNIHEEIYGDVKYQKHLLKGDTNGDKIVNGKDTALVVSEVKTAMGIN